MQERKVASGVPTALFGVAAGVFGLWALLTGRVPATGMPLLVGWFLAVLLAITVAGIMEFIRGDILLATVCMVFGPLIALGGASTIAIEVWARIPPAGMVINGWVWLCTAILLFLLDIPMWSKAWSLGIMQLEIAVTVLLFALVQTGTISAATFNPVCGWMFLIFGIYCFYAGMAEIINTTFSRVILPLGRPLLKVPLPQKES